MARTPTKSGGRSGDTPPVVALAATPPMLTVAQAVVLREAVSWYIRRTLRAPDVRWICEGFVEAVDTAIGAGGMPTSWHSTKRRRPWKQEPSDLPPELGRADSEPTVEEQAIVIREAVNYYLRSDYRLPEQTISTCEEFIAAIDAALGTGEITPLPDVPGVSISPTSATVAAGGGTDQITVTITSPGISGTWTVDKDGDATWLTYQPMTPQSTDGVINWAAAGNPTQVERVAHFYINGKTFTLTQEAAGPMSMVPVGVIVPLPGGNGQIAVTADAAQTWTVTKDAAATWLTFSPASMQSGSASVTWTVALNKGAARTGNLYIGDLIFHVQQNGVGG